ncbi:MAG: HlyD family efflux transporter periplasmic adaptor subunit [Planctomycetaceae bacterium]|jgi:multidrug efflux pump subunit AcrA (membrane-fusion protein)|nr:HlyD family efflux transporter periplasmic adaptor subunit [Planctomycetaceae bacterium]
MKKTKIFTFIRKISVSLLLILMTYIIIGLMSIPKPVARSIELDEPVSTVEVVPIERHTTGIDFKVDGEVTPFRVIDIVTEIQGRVIYKSENCRLGRAVRKGEILLQVDPTDYQLEVNQLTEAVKQATANIKENKVQLENTKKDLEIAKQQIEIKKRDYERVESLIKTNANTYSDLDVSLSNLLNTKDASQKLENQIRIYETQSDKLEIALQKEKINLQIAELNLERTNVKSPLDGVITSDSFEVNTFIQKGTSAAKILDPEQFEIQCSLYMKQIQWIWLSRSKEGLSNGYVFAPTDVTIVYEIDGEKWGWDGILQTLDGGGVDAVTRMVPCRVKVNNPKMVRLLNEKAIPAKKPPTLFFGMYVSIVVHSKPDVELYRIPEKALLPGNKIWTATGGKLYQHDIKVATTTPDGILFYANAESIADGDLVVVSPLANPVEGSNVNIIQTKNQEKTRNYPMASLFDFLSR